MPDYPGLGLPLRHNPQWLYVHYPIGAHGNCFKADSDMLPVRELAMMSIMERLTDKEEWYKKVFDEKFISKWREEALAIPDELHWKLAVFDKIDTLKVRPEWGIDVLRPLEGILNAAAFDYCVKELRSKAKYYEKTSIIPTLDACASVAKSDKLVPSDIHESLRKAFNQLKRDQSSAPDWHPGSNEMVQDLVHPSMYPLVYNRSRVLKEELVGVSDAVERWAGKGDIISKDETQYDVQGDLYRYGVGGSTVPPDYWSNTYQWLPANVAFQTDGTVKFTSYINNLHPNKYPEIYRTIESLIEAVLPAWDQCLAAATKYRVRDGAGRLKSRFPYPEDPNDENPENWAPSDPQAVANVEVDWEEVHMLYRYDPNSHRDETQKKWEFLRKPVGPDPSYEEIDYAPMPEKRLVEKFQESGLQIIVKMASIELSPDKPEFPAGSWHVEGQMNEHICGTALYYLDSENVTPSNLSFRMQTSAFTNNEIDVKRDCYSWMEQVYGTCLGSAESPCLQNYGSVETRQGRLLAFPNVFQHRVSPFRLEDPTKPGHRRFIALWLVDPTQRVTSTANVPPQQLNWWLDSVAGHSTEAREAAIAKLPAEIVSLLQDKGLDANISIAKDGKLPLELMEIVREHFHTDDNTLPMGLDEAREHRLKLMEVRGAFVRDAEEGWRERLYNFCEH